MPTILLTNYYSELPLKIIKEALPEGFDLITLENVETSILKEKIRYADYLLVSGRIPIDKEIIDMAVKLKMVQRTGVGLDTIDIDYLNKKGIPLYVNKGINAVSVAEHTLMLMLASLRRLPAVNKDVKNGIWEKQSQGLQNSNISGKIIGLIGIGSIAQHVAKMLTGFNVRTYYYSRNKLPESIEQELKVQYMPFDQLLKIVDIVSLHCPLNKDTYHLIGHDELKQMKPNSIIINTGRGNLIDEKALVDHLKKDLIRSAALDVFSQEPIHENNELLSFENVIVTPHIGGVTYDSFLEMMSEAMSNIRHFEVGNYKVIESRRLVNEGGGESFQQ